MGSGNRKDFRRGICAGKRLSILDNRLHERSGDRCVVGNHTVRDGVRTDQVGSVLVDYAHRRHLAKIALPRHESLTAEYMVEELLLSVVLPCPTLVFRHELRHVEESPRVIVIRTLEGVGFSSITIFFWYVSFYRAMRIKDSAASWSNPFVGSVSTTFVPGP